MRNNQGLFFLAALLTLCAVLFTTNTWAEDSKTQSEDIWTRDKLTGDWWGGVSTSPIMASTSASG
jgi:hypothetical protein